MQINTKLTIKCIIGFIITLYYELKLIVDYLLVIFDSLMASFVIILYKNQYYYLIITIESYESLYP